MSTETFAWHSPCRRAGSIGSQCLERDDWPLEDPKGKPLDHVRRIRDEIRDRVTRLLDTQGWRRSPSAS
jgi:protein-tyrosine-phosphatase